MFYICTVLSFLNKHLHGCEEGDQIHLGAGFLGLLSQTLKLKIKIKRKKRKKKDHTKKNGILDKLGPTLCQTQNQREARRGLRDHLRVSGVTSRLQNANFKRWVLWIDREVEWIEEVRGRFVLRCRGLGQAKLGKVFVFKHYWFLLRMYPRFATIFKGNGEKESWSYPQIQSPHSSLGLSK